MVYGTCNDLGSGLGQLLLILFVVDSGYVNASFVDAIDDLDFNNLMYELSGILGFYFDYDEDSIRRHPTLSAIPITRAVLLGYVASSKIMFFSGHGNINRIKLSEIDSEATYLTINNLEGLPDDTFSYCELMLLLSCLTASGGETGDNLINAFLAHGVETVVGFEVSILSSEATMWAKVFFNELANHKTVQQACELAWEYVAAHEDDFENYMDVFGGTEHFCIVGNKNKTF